MSSPCAPRKTDVLCEAHFCVGLKKHSEFHEYLHSQGNKLTLKAASFTGVAASQRESHHFFGFSNNWNSKNTGMIGQHFCTVYDHQYFPLVHEGTYLEQASLPTVRCSSDLLAKLSSCSKHVACFSKPEGVGTGDTRTRS